MDILIEEKSFQDVFYTQRSRSHPVNINRNIQEIIFPLGIWRDALQNLIDTDLEDVINAAELDAQTFFAALQVIISFCRTYVNLSRIDAYKEKKVLFNM